MKEALDIQVKGIVQGVGFRPFVYRLAKKYLIDGWVLNATDGVFIHAEGETKLLDEFVIELSENPPAASRVEEVTLKEVPLEDFDSFEIRFSDAGAVEKTTLVSPDLATCDDCARELFNPNDRRYRYPFINCTNCGPRFTIIEKLPYDRKSTSMKDFPMCERCAREYGDPLDRRFHAQPDACFECGPHISWREHEGMPGALAGVHAPGVSADVPAAPDVPAGASASHAAQTNVSRETLCASDAIDAPLGPIAWGTTREESDAILARAVELLLAGKILAVKGLGGFHLVCDASNPEAVALLRARKRREGKAFAVMMADMEAVRAYCEAGEAEEGILTATQRPIVLLRKRPDAVFAPGLADALPELGVMLPYTPLQHLLLHDFAKASGCAERSSQREAEGSRAATAVPMLVMTSGNIHDEPIVIDDEDAYEKLFAVADAFLGHDRAIRARYDDSVVRVIEAGSAGEAVQFIRRARGYAPLPLAMPAKAREGEDVSRETSVREQGCSIFATGPEQKNTFALTRDAEAFVSQHIGDLENAETYDAWFQAKDRYETLFEIEPDRIACDLHPEYLTSFERFANFAYVPMPGGAAAVKHPLRMAYGVLWAFDLLDHPGAAAALEALGEQAAVCDQMIDRGINTPMTSSVGRLFDAASALLGICAEPAYEGEPAILLEAAIGRTDVSRETSAADATDATPADTNRDPSTPALRASAQNDDAGLSASAREAASRYAIAVVKNTATAASTAQDTSVVLFDAAPAFAALLDDLAADVPVGVIARRFHDAFVQAIVTAAELVRSLYDITTLVLSGGVFMNRYLLEHALAALEQAGFTVAVNRDLPPNDGCISFGQAVVAWASSKEEGEQPCA